MQVATWRITGTEPRLVGDSVLTQADFQAIGARLDTQPIRARKTGFVRARRAEKRELIETRWNGKETSNTARKGDWIVTGLTPQQELLRDGEGHQNTYVVAAQRFPDLYELVEGKEAPGAPVSPFGAIYRAKGLVSALHLPGGFDILAPWGERQTAPAGYLILNGKDVYGNNAETFKATYKMLG
jgi:hypothetical protein